ncbi:hypothetical protein [Curtobacterium sp. ZW137]|uniref:hypothetical protein n=1 Tax=Curtobacterium sp. ZW137 TaxID=2485104 RepID=UPI000F4C2FC6|nr:hypothetical protein [Curtobacterium sp. ZW137]ROP66467.1 hypothetical protein EDF55_0923 [Curtobacterium sp. ZW137]
MNIPDFDIEPVVGPRFWMVVLGVVSAVAGVLAVIGWPLPVISSRHGGSGQHAWARTVRGVQDWFAHDGWRMSGASWIYGALAVAALAGIVVLLHPDWSGARTLSVVAGPAGALLVIGPAAQWALGLPWSNYGAGSTGGMALGVVVGLGGATVLARFRRAVRRSVRPDDDVNPPPRGVR